ncbi:4-hydroxy-3-methylbut-2-enyl diphosphate reductase [Porphyromonas sp.]|uniref:4-hydroxy-3-methylbut-2-enyl diphosphate reductase n=1 Tax=Porphyromonas sp. TaxID=1924944 RepID=UPI0026DB62DC|nr:4-hydroxy-3-methylbut-2-enyl diphosphate reductase [Porphyromonas sp.]MDO4695307.1 4-hydroxy-3-methylbut-2-enyl diphosphate reductase [Porphyromonas sp.]MDO4771030.1 4-hydroxy-3-methylbut-2-enyl diphosphate reductase [Porphyromonas sp.]
MIDIEINKSSGFCFGVINAIKHAEEELHQNDRLNCLGEIVHNSQEVERLSNKGLKTISYDDLKNLKDTKVLFRAHGEPPEIYAFARANNIQIVDATCPVVLRLQKRIRSRYEDTRKDNAQIIIYGKIGHAEVNGLVGQTGGEAIVVQKMDEISKIDYSRPVILFSQTTMSKEGFSELIESIQTNLQSGVYFEHYDTICTQVSNRIPDLSVFAKQKDWIYFIAGKNSSNGKVLYQICKDANPNTVFISTPEEITEQLPEWVRKVGICGATSTPKWLMEEVAEKLRAINL